MTGNKTVTANFLCASKRKDKKKIPPVVAAKTAYLWKTPLVVPYLFAINHSF